MVRREMGPAGGAPPGAHPGIRRRRREPAHRRSCRLRPVAPPRPAAPASTARALHPVRCRDQGPRPDRRRPEHPRAAPAGPVRAGVRRGARPQATAQGHAVLDEQSVTAADEVVTTMMFTDAERAAWQISVRRGLALTAPPLRY